MSEEADQVEVKNISNHIMSPARIAQLRYIASCKESTTFFLMSAIRHSQSR